MTFTLADIGQSQNVTRLINSGAAYCMCRFPGEEATLFVPSAAEGDEALFIAPWPGGSPTRLLRFDENTPVPVTKGEAFLDASLPAATSFEAYASQFEAIQSAFRQNGLKKAVLSRVKHVDKPTDFDPLRYFQKLEEAYPNALVYMLRLPGYGLWMGASPEVLLQKKGTRWLTHSLAATQPVKKDGKYTWSAKEREEQSLVSDHIIEVLHHLGIVQWQADGPHAIQAGSVAHLRTQFVFETERDYQDLIDALHPTPAVAGLPVDMAKALIEEVEHHHRLLYTGYLGRVKRMRMQASNPGQQRAAEQVECYVNLRCMQIGKSSLALYLGGGITPQSVLQNEWAETEHKALTLLKHLNG